MTVTAEDRDAMANLLNIMNGTPSTSKPSPKHATTKSYQVDLAGPGQVTRADVDAMTNVLQRLNEVSNTVVDEMITESVSDSRVAEALHTERMPDSVKVGRYQIMIKEDSQRLAGKQYYSIYNSLTHDIIVDDLSLYETALAVVRLLNNGKYANSVEVRKLFEQDDLYTSHRVDALIYKRKMAKEHDIGKKDIFESRFQASLDRCMTAKKTIKKMVADAR